MSKIHKLKMEELKEALSYDSVSGIFIWNIDKKKTKKGDIAGSIESTGYIRIAINGQRYQAHQLAWLYVYGSYPLNGYIIDHINQNKNDNRISNLRLVTHKENHQNKKLNSLNTSGCHGVIWHKRDKKWCANIRVDGKRIYLGYFDLYSDAVNARKNAEVLYGFHENHGKEESE